MATLYDDLVRLSARCHSKELYVHGFKLKRNECFDLNGFKRKMNISLGIRLKWDAAPHRQSHSLTESPLYAEVF